uniref:ImmA/IrrE family metallo-endopeptidase n=1 Tax=Bifidobacterium sp. UTCIF-39 TaxID=1465359 RepID=UPI0021599670|nr:ImmA/IrrE family metallo-endopeptidase [Bifidobacterium sp. UTCIF-39]
MIKLDDQMYCELKQNVVKAYRQLGFIRIPVDPLELLASDGIQAIPYSIGLNIWNLNDLMTLSACPSGMSIALEGRKNTTKLAFYNDYESQGRIRFTVAHEAAHCFLGHKEDSELAERQANLWARYAIAPPALIYCKGLRSAAEVADQFGLSNECAGYAFNAYMKWQNHRINDKQIDDSIIDLYMQGLLLGERAKGRTSEERCLQL